jgi:hypothetical protein
VLVLGVAFVLAGNSAAMLAYRLLSDGVMAIAWGLALVGIGWAVALKFDVPPLLRWATAFGVGFGVVSLLLLGLGLAGWLNAAAGWGLISVGLSLGAFWLVRARRRKPAATGPGSPWRWLWIVAVPFLGIGIAQAVVPPGLLWQDEPAGYDVCEYHLQVPREWFEARRVMPLRHNVFSYMPMNAELHDLLAMHLRGGPWAGMYLAQFMHLLTMAMAVVAVAGAAEAVGRRPWAGPLAGAAMSSVPWVTALAPMAYNEGALMLLAALAVGWVLLARDWRGWAMAGAIAGFACGVKLTAGPMLVGGVIIAWAGTSLVAALRRRQVEAAPDEREAEAARPPWRVVAIFAATALVTFAPWMIRNQVWAGNPVFPEAMSTLGRAHFDDVQVERWRRAHSAAEADRPVTRRLLALWERFLGDWRYGYLFLPLALIALNYGRGCQARFLRALFILQAVIWIGFTHLQGRFLILTIPIGAIAVGVRREHNWAPIAAGLIGVVAIVGLAASLGRHYRLVAELARTEAMGIEQVRWFVEPRIGVELEKLPADRPVVLVGEAQAFFYQLPMSRLRYRTVFDVPGAPDADWLAAWGGATPGQTVIVFPGELRRFTRTYSGVPAPSLPELERMGKPFVLTR